MSDLRLPTSELRSGDVVHEFGMKIRVEGTPDVYPSKGPGSPMVHLWPNCPVTNGEEVKAEGLVPLVYLYPGKWVGRDDWALDMKAQPTWSIQGSEHRLWFVEREVS